MAKERKFDDARQFEVDDEVEFVYDDKLQGDGAVHRGLVTAVRYGEDDQQIRHSFSYIVQFKDERDKEGLREVLCKGSELTLVA